MDWVVKNALSRDTEREQLNKILAEISASLKGTSTTQPPAVVPTVPSSTTGNGSSTSTRSLKITLTGDVEGEASGTTAISISTKLAVPPLLEAPVDGYAYWRIDGGWAQIPRVVQALSEFDDTGMLMWDSDDLSYNIRVLEGATDQIVVTDADGVNANPLISLADLADTGTGTFKLIERDAKGRVLGTLDGTTDDVPEGTSNLYYTDARADARVAIGIANHVAESDPHPQYAKKTLELNAGINISALKMVVSEDGDASYPDTSVPADAGRVVGLAITSATTGSPVTVLAYGEYSDAGWSWTPGPLFCGTAGTLTQTVPTGWVLEVGRALSATRVLINIKTPFIRS